MIPTLNIRTQGPIGRWVDAKFEWVMRYLSGAPEEATQRTHRWNNQHLKEKQVAGLNTEWMVFCPGDPSARKFPRIPILFGVVAHSKRYGGWQRYIVLAPVTACHWHVGWRWPGGGGVSCIPSEGPVKVLEGPEPAAFFGIETGTNVQIPINQIGRGEIGCGGEFAHIPLF